MLVSRGWACLHPVETQDFQERPVQSSANSEVGYLCAAINAAYCERHGYRWDAVIWQCKSKGPNLSGARP